MKSLEVARGLDPFSDSIVFATAVLHYCEKREELAMEECRKALVLNSDNMGAHDMLGILHLDRNDRESAHRETQEADKAGGDRGVRGLTGYLYGRLGEMADARRILDELGKGVEDPFARAQVLLGMGEKQRALEEFQKAVEGRSSFLVMFYGNPYLDEIFNDRKLPDMLAKAKLKRA
jgi:tetratricopeptide (TPR) repeat protein